MLIILFYSRWISVGKVKKFEQERNFTSVGSR
eukprot:UN03042